MKLLRILLIITILFLLSISGGFGYFVYTVMELEALPEASKPLTTRIYDANQNLVALRYAENRFAVSLEEISPYVIAATIAVEDRRFNDHFGFDLAGVARAILNNIRERQILQGGSTITQQLAKNLFLTHDQTLERKIKEVIYAVHLERKYTKDQILEQYLNTIYYGHGAYGIEAASQTYFGKKAADLTLAEAALLAGLPRSPNYYSPYVNEEAAVQRQKTVLNLMEEQGFIGEEEKADALAEPLVFKETGSEEYSSYYLDYLINYELKTILGGDLTPIYYGGLQVYTTLDRGMQKAALETLEAVPVKHTDEHGVRQPQGALLALDPATGAVKAMAGGRNYQESKLNRVLSYRSPGSAFKPLIYAAALENGYTAADRVKCDPVALTEQGLDSPYEPTDYGGTFHHEELSLRQALAKSCNIIPIKLHVEQGRDKIAILAEKLGIKTTIGNYFSIPLGSIELTLWEITGAFAAFANGGYRVEPYLVEKIIDAAGNILYSKEPSIAPALQPETAYIITDMLKGVLSEEGTADQAGKILNRPAAGKSGTSQNTINAYMIGYTPDLVAGLYIGDDHEKPLDTTGGHLAAPLWADFMEKALQNYAPRDFEKPAGVIEITICEATGLKQSENCKGPSFCELFAAGTEPEDYCDCPKHGPQLWWPWLPYGF